MTYKSALWLINADRNISGICQVEFEDAEVTLPVRPVIVMLPFWEVYRRMGRPVTTKQIFFTDAVFNDKRYTQIMQQIYNDCFEDSEDKEYFNRLIACFWDVINNVDDFGTNELLEYVCSLSIIDLAELYNNPKVREIVTVPIDEDEGPMMIKKKFIKGQKDLFDLLASEEFIENNPLYPFASTKTIKPSQLFQVMGHYGLRTEINDRVFRRPVYGNAMNGLRDFADMVLENSASRKNVYYSHDAIRLSQYFNREMALAAMSMRRLYPGYCGSDVQLPFVFKPTYAKYCIGKYFYLPDDKSRTLRVITEDNIEQYLDVPVLMFSPFTCRHTDGVCERCLGMIARNHTDGINVGITSTSNLVSEIAQLILSIKHDDQAIPMIYRIPDEASEWFKLDVSGIKFNRALSKYADRLELGIYFTDINCSTGDLEHIDLTVDVPENKYSRIRSVLFKDNKDDTIRELVMVNEDMTPFLTTEFLVYLKENLSTMVSIEQDVLWIKMGDLYKKGIPILRSVVTNNSMMLYVTHLVDLFKKSGLSKYTNASKALIDVSAKVFERVTGANIFQLEMMMRAHMVTSKTDYSIPIVTNTKSVMFAKTADVIANRTISGQLAHEGHKQHFANPFTFTTLKDQSVLDPFMSVQ